MEVKKGKDKKSYIVCYKNIEFDRNGWADSEKFKPTPFDLVQAVNNQGWKRYAWWTGQEWDSSNEEILTGIIKWKRFKDHSDDFS